MKNKFLFLLATAFLFGVYSQPASARSSKPRTLGIMGMGNIQLIDATPELDPGAGGGIYFDYRFNQRFSITTSAWVTDHDGAGGSDGDNGILLLGIPDVTIKLYFLSDESSNWDPYAGIGIGVYALTEGSRESGGNGVGIGAHVDLGVDYYASDVISLGFAGIFRSAAIITSISDNSNASAIIPFSLVGKIGFHF